ncbi:MAG: transposase [Acidobacteriota bacterium]
MERRFELRKEAVLAECEVSPQVFRGAQQRLAKFAEPFVELLRQPAQRQHTEDYVSGLLSDLERKNVESIAYRHDQDRRNLQHFIGGAQWDHQPLLMELAKQVGQGLGEEDGVIVFDPSAFPKKKAALRHSCGKRIEGAAEQYSWNARRNMSYRFGLRPPRWSGHRVRYVAVCTGCFHKNGGEPYSANDAHFHFRRQRRQRLRLWFAGRRLSAFDPGAVPKRLQVGIGLSHDARLLADCDDCETGFQQRTIRTPGLP